MKLSQDEAIKLAKERGLISQDYEAPKNELSKQDAIQIALERGLIKPREDGAGFLVRSRFSFADTDKGRKQVLEDEYGKGNAYKIDNRWLVKDKSGWNYVDEDGLSWNDAADIIGDIPEMIGASAGMLAGSGVASVPMAAGGATAGRGAKKVIAKLWGIEDNQSATDIAKDLGESALWSGTGQVVGLGAAKSINKLAAPFRSKMTPEAVARRDLASKYGVELTPAQVTQSPTLGQVENVLNNRLWSSDELAKFADTKQITPFNEAIKNITPLRNTDEIGLALINAINDTKTANKQMFNKEYGSIASQINKPIDVDNLISQAGHILAQNKNIPKSAQDAAVKISNEILESPYSNMTYAELSKLRTNLGDMARGGSVTGDVGTAQYKLLKGALDKDFDTFATYNGLGSIKKDVDEAYKIFKNRYEDPLIKSIVGTDKKQALVPESVVSKIVSPNKVTTLESVKNASNNPNLVKDAVIDKVITNSKIADTSNPMFGSDMVTPTRFATQTHKFGRNLSSVGADDVRELGKVAESIKYSDSFANHSNTAPTLLNSSVLGLISPLNLGGKLYTSKVGRKYLTDGYTPLSSKYFGVSGAELGTFTNGEKLLGSTGAKSGLSYSHKREEY